MKVGFVYAASWEHAYRHAAEPFDQTVWCASDDFIMKYPRAAKSRGIEPLLFYFSERAREVATFTHKYGFPMRRIPVRWRAGRLGEEFSFGLFQELARERFDLLHFYNYYRGFSLPDTYNHFAHWCRRRAVPFVAHYQGGQFPGSNTRSRWKRALLAMHRRNKARALKIADRIFVLNRAETDRLCNPADPEFYGFPLPPGKCVYLPNIIDTGLFRPMDRHEARRSLLLDRHARVLLYAGHLRQGKGIQDLIHILPELRGQWPRLRLLVVGTGEYEPTLRRQAAMNNLEEAIEFRGAVPNNKLSPLYSAADALVLPSYAEGMPSVLLEAMACGTACVATRVGGIPDLLADGAGLLVNPGDRAALLEALRQVLGGRFTPNPSARQARLGEHSYEQAGTIVSETYERILAEHNPRKAGDR